MRKIHVFKDLKVTALCLASILCGCMHPCATNGTYYDLSTMSRHLLHVYTRVLTRVDLNPDSNPAIGVGWINLG
jgi:ABC-type uncharacterized transport system auxiliary subunit